MRYFLLFVILINARFSVSEDCSIVSEDGKITLVLTNRYIIQDIGEISKKVSVGDVVGVFNVSNVTPTGTGKGGGKCDPEYFGFSFAENKITFQITDKFKDFDTNLLDDNYDSPYNCSFELYFDKESCPDIENGVNLQYKIKDYNLHKPEFNKIDDFQINYPVAAGVSLTTFTNEEFIAKDIDFSTKVLSFKFEEETEYFDLNPGAPSSHNFSVDIITKKVLNFQRPITLTIIATDDGTDPGPNSGEITITISPGENSTPPTPEFENSYYEGSIDLETANENQPISSGIKLQENYDKITVDCDWNGYFKCDKDANNIDVNVVLLKKPEQDFWAQGPVIILPIVAKIEGSSKPGIAPFVVTLKNIPSEQTTTDSTTITTEPTSETLPNTDSTSETSPNTDSTSDTPPNTDSTSDTPPGTDSTSDTPPNTGSTSDTSPNTGSTSGTPPNTGSTSDTPPSTGSESDTQPNTDNTPPLTNPTGDTPPATDPDPTDNIPTQSPCLDGDDDSEKSDLIVTIIVLSILAGVLLIALIVMYFKYVRGRKTDEKAFLLESDSNNIETIGPTEMRLEERREESVESEMFSKPLDALPENDEIEIQNEIDRKPKGLDSLIAEQEENNLLKPDEVKSRKRSMTFSESDDESRQYRENLSKPVMTEVINENKPDPVRKKSAVTFKL